MKCKRKKGTGGFTLMELMVVVAISSIVLTGLVQWMNIMRKSWQDAALALEQTTMENRLFTRVVRGGFGYGTGLQSAVDVALDQDAARGVNILYSTSDGGFFAIHFMPDGSVRQVRQQNATPWWSGGNIIEERSMGRKGRFRITNATLFNSQLVLDYMAETKFGELVHNKPGHLAWKLRI